MADALSRIYSAEVPVIICAESKYVPADDKDMTSLMNMSLHLFSAPIITGPPAQVATALQFNKTQDST